MKHFFIYFYQIAFCQWTAYCCANSISNSSNTFGTQKLEHMYLNYAQLWSFCCESLHWRMVLTSCITNVDLLHAFHLYEPCALFEE